MPRIHLLYSILNSCFFHKRKKKAMCIDDNTKIYIYFLFLNYKCIGSFLGALYFLN